MLHLSMTTLLMTVLTTNLFLVILTIFLCDTKLMIRAGYKLLGFFAVFVLLRLLLPCEFAFTKTLRLPLAISKVAVFFRNGALFYLGTEKITLWRLFKWIWGIGFAVGLARYLLAYLKARYAVTLYGKVVTDTEPYRRLLERICREHGRRNRFTVIEMPGLDVPVLFGIFAPRILVPERFALPETDIYYILQHEASHHFHHDLLLKCLIRLITLMYWWDPFCILLNRQTDVLLEMRIDHDLTLTKVDSTMDYMNCLINASEYAHAKAPVLKSFTMALLPTEQSDLQKRYIMLYNNQEKRKNSVPLAFCVLILLFYIFSYSFILEIYYYPGNMAPAPLSYGRKDHSIDCPYSISENSYCIDNGDGTYDIYYNNEYLLTDDSLQYYPRDIVIYTKDNCPK